MQFGMSALCQKRTLIGEARTSALGQDTTSSLTSKRTFRCYDSYGSPGLNGNSLPGGTLSSLIARIIAAVT